MSENPATFTVKYVADARRSEWMAGMELDWTHQALLIWTTEGDDGDGVDPRMRRALWAALNASAPLISITREIQDLSSKGIFRRMFNFTQRPAFEMHWALSFAEFSKMFDNSIYFALALDPGTPLPKYPPLRFWHDQVLPPADIAPVFANGLQLVLRSGADEMCFGVFARDAETLQSFHAALASAVTEESGSLHDCSEPGA